MKPLLYKISRGFARREHLPIFFVGVVLAETPKAVYIYGRGTVETQRMGVCCVCGRKLTHPVSVELGIGPECGSHWWDWKLVGGYTKENIERLKEVVRERIEVDCWMPKAVIIQQLKSEETVDVPPAHRMLNVKENKPSARKATLTTFRKSGKNTIKIEFPYNTEDLDRVRSLSDRKYHPETKVWSARVCSDNVEKLDEWGFEIDSNLKDFIKKTKLHISDVSEMEVPGLKKKLYPFQKKGVAFIEAKDGRALIGDEMGLGKTVQALAWLQLHPEKRPVIIVVPASLKLNWARETEAWTTNSGLIQILQGTKITKLMGDTIIINYDILTHWVGALLKMNPKVLIIDEVHYVKSNSAKRTKAVQKLGKKIPHVIALSGTPIVNRPIEIYNAVKLIDDTVLPSRWDYVERYCGKKYNGFGWDFSGATNTEELHYKLTNSLMIRRKKVDVLPDLPEKIRAFTPMELDNSDEYYAAERDFISFVKNQKGAEAAEKASNAQALVEIETLKQLAVRGKLKQSIKWIQDFLAVDGKLVVFAVHKFVVDALMEEFAGVAVKVDGSVTGLDRQKAVDEFQTNKDVRLFIGNVKAAGVGITLTASSTVAFLELPWTPGEVTQAEDRTHRIGQKNSVMIHYLLANDTIEEKIARLIDSKRKVLDAVLDGKVTEETSLLSELMNEYES